MINGDCNNAYKGDMPHSSAVLDKLVRFNGSQSTVCEGRVYSRHSPLAKPIRPIVH